MPDSTKETDRSTGYRPDWWPDSGGTYLGAMGVLDMSLALHMSHTGASDSLKPEDEALYLRCLEWLLENWVQSRSMYERAVHTLIIRTLNERKPEPYGPPDLICRRP